LDRGMMRRHPFFLAFVVGAVFMAAGAKAVAGCETASPEHLGTWRGSNKTETVTITVAGTPGDYTAEVERERYSDRRWTGGKADSSGRVVFIADTLGEAVDIDLILGPVSGDTMTATIIVPDDEGPEVYFVMYPQ
jgi:hypothetical protein